MIKIPGKAFAEALATVGKAVERRSTIPILSNVKLAGVEGKLSLSATNLDIWIDLSIDVEGEIEPICTPADKLRAAALAAGPDLVEIDLRPSRMAVRYGRGRALLDVLPAVEFPVCERIAADRSAFVVEAAELARAIAMVGPSVSSEASRMYLNGAHLRRGRSGLTLAACDGHRLNRTLLKIIEGGADFPDGGAIIPRQMLPLLASMGGQVAVETDGQRLRASSGGLSITSRLIAATFPEIDRIIPETGSIAVTFNAPDLARAVEQVVWATGDKERSIGIHFAPGKPGIVWSRFGDAEAEFDCEAEREADIGLNAGYLSSLLSRVGEVEVGLCLDNALATKFVADPADDHVICPVRMESYQPNKEMIDG